MKKYLHSLMMLLSVATFLQAQNLTKTENYVYSRTYLEPVTVSNSEAKQAQTVTYIDGLGRAKQSISIKATPAGKDIVKPIEYDGYGRQTINMLPLPQQGTNNGGIYSTPDMTGAMSVYGNASNYYAEKKLEYSPLNRVLEASSPGDPWKMETGKTVKYTYQTNGDTEVKRFVVSTAWTTVSNIAVGIPAPSIPASGTDPSSTGGYYLKGTLYKTIITDEDGNTATKFINGKGQTILVRKNDGTQNIDTYYVYDEYGQQTFVIPPSAVKLIEAAGGTISSSVLNDLCYQYRYDNQNRMVEKKFPGRDWEFMVYDKQDRIVLIQDGNLRTLNNNFGAKGWIFTKYDNFGRTVYTGFFANTATRPVMQNSLNSMASNAGNNEESSTTPIVQDGMNVYYTKKAFPTGSMTILSVNYYDEYPQDTPSKTGLILGQELLTSVSIPLTINGVMTTRSTKGLPTASYIRNISDTNWTRDYFWYDRSGREIGTHSINHLGGYTITETELDFTGAPKQITTTHKRKSSDIGIKVKERFEYDSANRLVKHWHKVDDRAEQLLTENTYNELSQLINKKVGNNLQSIDYTYNIRGWLTDINKSDMSAPNLNGKLFSYRIKYNQKDGTTNPDQVLFPGKDVKSKYNGNITEVDWRAVESIGANPPLEPKRYGYAYDALNRLTAGYYQNPNNPWSKEHTEVMDYDINGNISNMYRTSVVENSTTATVIDRLAYGYAGNKVININDLSTNPSGYEGGGNTITYDANGNMENLLDKRITSIKYNFLNLPERIEISNLQGGGIGFKYTADGTKLQKTNSIMECGIKDCYTVSTVSDYLDGFQYVSSTTTGGGSGSIESLAVSREMSRAMEMQAYTIGGIGPIEPGIDPPIGGGEFVLKDADLSFFPTSEGYYDYKKDQYIYQYKDLYGNVRVSFGRNSADVLEIVDANDYYPFGMNHLKTGNAFYGKRGSGYKNYKFLGKELQETGFYDLGARFYMPELGIFAQHDPLSAATLDPYGYAYNNPMFFSDPTGLYGAQINKKGELPATSPGGADNPLDVGEVVINAPIRAMASNPGSVLPSNCQLCYSGRGMQVNITLSPPRVKPLPPNWNCGHCNDGPIMYVGGAGDPWGIWELLGIIASTSEEPSLKLAALPLLMVTKNSDDALKLLAAEKGAIFGSSTSNNYKANFFKANPKLKGTVVVHHAVEQQVLKRYPGIVTESEMHSLDNLRGIPKTINSDVHLSQIRKIWNKFYKETPNPTKQDLLDQATLVDKKFGSQFTPKVE
ncbi:RHS repeat-associated core domain-containing protein [Chryseobacterium joostei]|uniref:RHS repeat-associated core domain-containing protein n=1 Tax=Chryseobacterium joostei TaxID=112234 RepID=A0A1N7KJZ4_9FLAO|nr:MULTISPECIES: DUF6443 domain-containing protein [Chryseobacterium]AZA77808.1 RHS repeat-associated core domain-containing protein [Chryseobacterium sp. G0186]AZB00003.1 RHS repeat-associated core domain-containing protein [Chryseobacterium joostei]SIS61905.1 RHS repeat-associated core domain-containing protein [Chryseobacterium joostei]